MMNGYDKPLTPAQIAGTEDENIDFSDIPELDDLYWQEAELVEPDLTEEITLRVKRSVLAHFRGPGKGYETRINRVLESYVRARREHR
ncbi:MAG: 3-oxoacyl-ACP synthase [Nitrospira sp. SB0677_bin_15]|nr:3-oxoacyl-ACP synthase [Nitrospira sp. SB0667_bin_9]MYD30308.1 3-oxoacyl-ACP synthase [Nitrospira sp. SB0661_bin_20]MYG40580.1 3-oxoacyl-ACP synthase [Nitrospira sp. SB0677_bin_15]MYH01284.1 3-oxoacyl-ACP synthase [Nitrospira sp. SB0675_bin_23]MYJ21843.1 3-oxoacyl-ACP synthase [Nitrospira sp. SB0673_bin_12]